MTRPMILFLIAVVIGTLLAITIYAAMRHRRAERDRHDNWLQHYVIRSRTMRGIKAALGGPRRLTDQRKEKDRP